MFIYRAYRRISDMKQRKQLRSIFEHPKFQLLLEPISGNAFNLTLWIILRDLGDDAIRKEIWNI